MNIKTHIKPWFTVVKNNQERNSTQNQWPMMKLIKTYRQ